MILAVAQAAHHFEWSWFTHAFGIDNSSGPQYAWWSGAGSDLGELAIIAAVIGTYRSHSCHVTGCWRIARHPIEGSPFRVCRKHHPAVPAKVTAEHIAEAHRQAHQPPPSAPAVAKRAAPVKTAGAAPTPRKH